MIFTGTKESVYIRKEFNFFETGTGRPFHCSGTPIGNLSKDDENVKTSAYFGHFRNEKRTGVEMHLKVVSGIVTGDTPVSYWPIGWVICKKRS